MFNKTPFDQGAAYSYGPTSTSAAPGAALAPAAAAPAGPPAGLPPDMPLVYDISEAEFEAGVLELSMQVPVLLDCWAPWCGPCKSLGPVLERLAEAYGGRFLLAKLNTDEAPNISAALRLRSIPLVMLFVGGRPVDQFVGALPEGQIRAFLDKHLPPAPVAEEAPPSPLDVAEALIADGDLDNAQALLDGLPDGADAKANERRDALKARIALARNRPPGDVAELQARLATNPRDFEARFALGALQAWAGEWSAAFDSVLEVVLRDKAEGKPDRERARKQLIDWFAVCPDAEAVSRGRRYLGMYLN
jgi:putative thioredoxin